MVKDLEPGLYGPLPTFFDEHENIDYGSYKKHLLNLASKNIVPVCAGSLGEAVHLDSEERVDLIKFIRSTLDEAGLNAMPIVAGVGGSSTRETISLAKAAADAGADAGLVILPAYYAASLSADHRQIVRYYVDICTASPIPLFLYNFPANSAGLDMSSDIIEKIMAQTENLCGVKLTCGGSIAKLIRLSAAVTANPTVESSRRYPFLLLDGLIADLTPWMQCGGHGTVSGIPNFAPATSVRLWALLNKGISTEQEGEEARRIQSILSKADVAAVPAGVRGMSELVKERHSNVMIDMYAEYVLNKIHGYGQWPRRPLLPLEAPEGDELMVKFADMLALEEHYQKLV